MNTLIYRKRECTAEQAKRKLLLRASGRTIQRYLNRLGWRKIRTKYCHFVTVKNRIERVVYCNFCLINGERFFFSIHIDECTVAMNKNGRTQWFRKFSDETRSGLQSKYKHTASVHIIGGISRRGATKLIVFTGKNDSDAFQDLAGDFLIPFIIETYPDHHRIQMDNAKFHTSIETVDWLVNNNLNHFKTPPQSPDLNPIGNYKKQNFNFK